jgi:hypothetical protein
VADQGSLCQDNALLETVITFGASEAIDSQNFLNRSPTSVGVLDSTKVKILWRCWKDNTAYDEEKYLAALARKNRPS